MCIYTYSNTIHDDFFYLKGSINGCYDPGDRCSIQDYLMWFNDSQWLGHYF